MKTGYNECAQCTERTTLNNNQNSIILALFANTVIQSMKLFDVFPIGFFSWYIRFDDQYFKQFYWFDDITILGAGSQLITKKWRKNGIYKHFGEIRDIMCNYNAPKQTK